jgi:hypothetical protein
MSKLLKADELLSGFTAKADQILCGDAQVLPRTLAVLVNSKPVDANSQELEKQSINDLLQDILDARPENELDVPRQSLIASREFERNFTNETIDHAIRASSAYCVSCAQHPEKISAIQDFNASVDRSVYSQSDDVINRFDVSECERVERYVYELSLIDREISGAIADAAAETNINEDIQKFRASTSHKTTSIELLKDAAPVV